MSSFQLIVFLGEQFVDEFKVLLDGEA